MKNLLFVCLLASCAIVSGSNLIVPAYFYPSQGDPDWTTLYKTTPASVSKYVIVNVNSGPGTTIDTDYAAAIKNLTNLGFIPVGYVDTNYGAVAVATVQNNINLWRNLYSVYSHFFDQASSGSAKYSYYQQIFDYVKANSSSNIVITNQGTDPDDERYVNATDIMCNFETSYSQYLNYVPKSWIKNYPSTKFYHIVYNVSSAQLSNAFAIANATNGGYVYFTGDLLPNPYDSMPTYWTQEVTFAVNSATTTTTSTSSATTGTTTGTTSGSTTGTTADSTTTSVSTTSDDVSTTSAATYSFASYLMIIAFVLMLSN